MKDFIMYFLFGDKKRSMLFICAIVCDYIMFNLVF